MSALQPKVESPLLAQGSSLRLGCGTPFWTPGSYTGSSLVGALLSGP